MAETSACEWRGHCRPGPREGTAMSRPWLEEGYSKKYPWFVARAVFAIAQWAAERRTHRFRFVGPTGYPYSLFWLATSYPFLKKATDLTSVRGNAPGPDGKTFYELFQSPDWTDSLLRTLKYDLRNWRLLPGGLRRVVVEMGGKCRPLDIPNILERVVQRAILLVLTPVFEFSFHENSFGFRPCISTAHAFQALKTFCCQYNRWVVGRMDLKNAFHRAPHNRLLDVVRKRVPDTNLMRLLAMVIKRPGWMNDQGKSWVGLPQGGPLSPLLFNVYLNHNLDQVLARRYPEIKFIRWADDFVLLCKDHTQLKVHGAIVEKLLSDAGLAVNRRKTDAPGATASLKEGEKIEFLGLQVSCGSADDIRLGVGEDAWARLYGQLFLDVAGQRPNVTWDGLRVFLRDQILYTVGSWLEAYAGGISPNEWPMARATIKSLFVGNPPKILADGKDWVRRLPVECLSNTEINARYERARALWDHRINTPVADTIQRISYQQRDARASKSIRQMKPDLIADGADLVPAPSAFVEPYGERKPGPERVEWRVELAPPALK